MTNYLKCETQELLFISERERESVCVCVCVCVWERERERERESWERVLARCSLRNTGTCCSQGTMAPCGGSTLNCVKPSIGKCQENLQRRRGQDHESFKATLQLFRTFLFVTNIINKLFCLSRRSWRSCQNRSNCFFSFSSFFKANFIEQTATEDEQKRLHKKKIDRIPTEAKRERRIN